MLQGTGGERKEAGADRAECHSNVWGRLAVLACGGGCSARRTSRSSLLGGKALFLGQRLSSVRLLLAAKAFLGLDRELGHLAAKVGVKGLLLRAMLAQSVLERTAVLVELLKVLAGRFLDSRLADLLEVPKAARVRRSGGTLGTAMRARRAVRPVSLIGQTEDFRGAAGLVLVMARLAWLKEPWRQMDIPCVASSRVEDRRAPDTLASSSERIHGGLAVRCGHGEVDE